MAKPQKRKLARELRRQGWSVRVIEDELGVSRSSVSRWTHDINYLMNKKSDFKKIVDFGCCKKVPKPIRIYI